MDIVINLLGGLNESLLDISVKLDEVHADVKAMRDGNTYLIRLNL